MEEVQEKMVKENPTLKGSIIQIVFLILLLAAIFALIIAITSIYKNKEMLMNPL